MKLRGLKGKVSLIVGASRGIGRAVAERFAQEGMNLVLNHQSDVEAMERVEQACGRAGIEVAVRRGDIGDLETAEGLFELAMKRFGRIDVLVNNAGVSFESPLGTVEDHQVRQMVSTNAFGLVWMTRAVLRAMIPQRSGVIVNLSSCLASRPSRGNAVYAGTKGFVESFTRAMAAELGRKNIRVNAISPGVIDTDMSKPIRHLAEDLVLDRIGLKRLGAPQEVAAAAAFLASEEASYISGAVLSVDGAFLGGA